MTNNSVLVAHSMTVSTPGDEFTAEPALGPTTTDDASFDGPSILPAPIPVLCNYTNPNSTVVSIPPTQRVKPVLSCKRIAMTAVQCLVLCLSGSIVVGIVLAVPFLIADTFGDLFSVWTHTERGLCKLPDQTGKKRLCDTDCDLTVDVYSHEGEVLVSRGAEGVWHNAFEWPESGYLACWWKPGGAVEEVLFQRFRWVGPLVGLWSLYVFLCLAIAVVLCVMPNNKNK
eukprot:TRINITY_DN103284_c0_g1_i1.p1 TRINITY_DN103284_c0_g1~~TRINITY_DN103284_c0_g1_i1.p1  ORF type:complete len:228 (-),score=8.47 TRINITY_DN103284_c0_g1_i1:76-759(-)